MGLSATQAALWISAVLLELILATTLFSGRWYRRIPVFVSYIGLVLLSECVIFAVYRFAGYQSRIALYTFWFAQLALLIVRAGAIGELGWNASRPYPGFRVLVKWCACLIGCLLVARALLLSVANVPRLQGFVLSLQSGLELTAAALLLFLLALASRYDVPLLPGERWIAFGLLLYSAVQVANDAFSSQLAYFAQWNLVRTFSYHVVLVIWIYAAGRDRPASPPDAGGPHPNVVRDLMERGTAVSQQVLDALKAGPEAD